MKRVLMFTIFLGVLFLTYQFLVMLFVSNHHISYRLEEKEQVFFVQESYTLENKKHDYYFEIETKGHHFTFHNTSNLNKKKQVIQKIEYFESGNLSCIYPVLGKGKENKQNDILCTDQSGKLYDYSYLKQQNNLVVNAFVQRLQQLEYLNPSWKEENKKEVFAKLTIYPENMLKDYYIALWNYRGVDVISQNSRHSFPLVKKDRYENTHSRLIDKYYILPNYDQKYDFTDWIILDIVEWRESKLSMKGKVSFDSYINGIVGDELYLLDKNNKIQYAINPITEKIRIVGNAELNGQYYENGAWETRNIYDFINQELYFVDEITLSELEQQYGKMDIKQSGRTYYFKTEDGKIYLTFQDHLDQAVLLFQDPKMVDWKVEEGVIYFLSDSTIYQYDEYSGLKPVIESNELRYNYKNIFEVYKK